MSLKVNDVITYKEFTIAPTRPEDPNTTWQLLEYGLEFNNIDKCKALIDDVHRLHKNVLFKDHMKKIMEDE